MSHSSSIGSYTAKKEVLAPGIESLDDELQRLQRRNKYLEVDNQLLMERNIWLSYGAEERNDSVQEKISWVERILDSLTDDEQLIEFISRLKRSESYQAIAGWLGQSTVGSHTQIPPLATEHQISTPPEACSPADSGGEEAVAHESVSLTGNTRLQNDSVSTQVGHTKL